MISSSKMQATDQCNLLQRPASMLVIFLATLTLVKPGTSWQLEPLMLGFQQASNQMLTPSYGSYSSQATAGQPLASVSSLLQHQPRPVDPQPPIEQPPVQASSPAPPRPLEELVSRATNSVLAEPAARPAAPETANVSAVTPPAAGKILETVIRSASELLAPAGNQSSVGSSSESQSVSQSGSKLQQAALQLMKPRKQVPTSSPTKLEEQIINQHARLHPSSGSHQRLLATKQRDNKILGSLAGAQSAGNSADSSRSFSLSGLIGHLKLGGLSTSRSSIVKAISDNKLARTMAEVGKTVGSNKYVASAAAASAIAALGLTISKLIMPHLFAANYNAKVGDPMMGSASSSSGISTSPLFMDRNTMIYDPTGNVRHSANVFGSPYLSYAGPEYGSGFGEQSSPFQQGSNAGFYYASPTSHQVYMGYSPKPTLSPQENGQGYYSTFYDNQPSGEVPASSQPSTTYSDYNGRPALLEPPSAPAPVLAPTTPSRGDQMQMSASSYRNPASFAQPPRRTGAVALRLDENTKRRLLDQLKRHQEQQVSSKQQPNQAESVVVYTPVAPTRPGGGSWRPSGGQSSWQIPERNLDQDNKRAAPSSNSVETNQAQAAGRRDQGQSGYQAIRPNKASLEGGNGEWRSMVGPMERESWRSKAITTVREPKQPLDKQTAGEQQVPDTRQQVAAGFDGYSDKVNSAAGQKELASGDVGDNGAGSSVVLASNGGGDGGGGGGGQVSMSRFSRTPNQWSVKSRHPNEALTDGGGYGFEMSASETKSASKFLTKPAAKPMGIVMLESNIAPPSTTSSSRSSGDHNHQEQDDDEQEVKPSGESSFESLSQAAFESQVNSQQEQAQQEQQQQQQISKPQVSFGPELVVNDGLTVRLVGRDTKSNVIKLTGPDSVSANMEQAGDSEPDAVGGPEIVVLDGPNNPTGGREARQRAFQTSSTRAPSHKNNNNNNNSERFKPKSELEPGASDANQDNQNNSS